MRLHQLGLAEDLRQEPEQTNFYKYETVSQSWQGNDSRNNLDNLVESQIIDNDILQFSSSSSEGSDDDPYGIGKEKEWKSDGDAIQFNEDLTIP